MKLNKKLITLSLLTGTLITNVYANTKLNCINENNTNLVPLRTMSEEFGAKVEYIPEAEKVIVTYKDRTIETTIGSKIATVNGEQKELLLPPKVKDGVTYVPIRFVGEALGGQVGYKDNTITMTLGDTTKNWGVNIINTNTNASQSATAKGDTFKSGSQVVDGRKINYVKINMNDPAVKVDIATSNGTVTQAQSLKALANGYKVGVNGTYFAAYNGDMPLPDGTIVKNDEVLHITDIGSTIGFTKDNKVLIDFVKTRLIGYVNGERDFMSYRVNRPGYDIVVYTDEYGANVPIKDGLTGFVCLNGEVVKKATAPRTVPKGGSIIVDDNEMAFKIGDKINYEVSYEPVNTSAEEWENVECALSAGPSLVINGKKTGNPKDEHFTESKILTQVAQRTFIGVTANNEVMIGTVSASVAQLKDIVLKLGLKSAMCLDGGASSGLYYNGDYITSPGRNISNAIVFK